MIRGKDVRNSSVFDPGPLPSTLKGGTAENATEATPRTRGGDNREEKSTREGRRGSHVDAATAAQFTNRWRSQPDRRSFDHFQLPWCHSRGNPSNSPSGGSPTPGRLFSKLDRPGPHSWRHLGSSNLLRQIPIHLFVLHVGAPHRLLNPLQLLVFPLQHRP